MDSTGGYYHIYESLLEKLRKHDLAEAAPRLGLHVNERGGVNVDFLGASYRINNDGIWPSDGKPRNINIYNVLAYYALSNGVGEPAYVFEPLRSSAYGYSDLSWMTKNRLHVCMMVSTANSQARLFHLAGGFKAS